MFSCMRVHFFLAFFVFCFRTSLSVIVAISFGLLYALMRLVWHCTHPNEKDSKDNKAKTEKKKQRNPILYWHITLYLRFFFFVFFHSLLSQFSLSDAHKLFGCVYCSYAQSALTLNWLFDAVSKKCANEKNLLNRQKNTAESVERNVQ